ncbi:BA75_04104T0 [Komagataella pastoris]|uniref:BA75_04104T0 n=1 Tax=Komagataella pastoris TaxID=4922 RepID=A0A1B2JEL1_PICPA|nr:BA75_04104T0 [Komagataella pastoris]
MPPSQPKPVVKPKSQEIFKEHSFLDTFALTVVFITLPSWLALLILSVFGIFSYSKNLMGKIVFFWSYHNTQVTVQEIYSMFMFFVVDVCLYFLLLHRSPKSLKYVYLLAKAFVASTITSPKHKFYRNAFLTLFIIFNIQFLDHWLKDFLKLPSRVNLSTEFLYYRLNDLLLHQQYLKRLSNPRFSDLVDFFIQFSSSIFSMHIVLINLTKKVPLKLKGPFASSTEKDTNDHDEIGLKSIGNSILEVEIPEDIEPLPFTNKLSSAMSAPASYPTEAVSETISVSSPLAVVARNFENFAIFSFVPSIHFSIVSSNRAILDKKLRSISLSKIQQPIWAFLSAAKTMFNKQDLYSGEMDTETYQNRTALIHHNDSTSLTSIVQCFTSYVGETSIAFELYRVQINEVKIRVNGIVWYQVCSASIDDREIIVVNGLSPLSQYDIELFNISESNKQFLLANVTVSTISPNCKLSQAKKNTPLLTLQESLATTNEHVNREKLKLKKTRKDYSQRTQAIKNEIEILKKKLYANDKTDERNYRRKIDLKQELSKLDQENSELESQHMDLFTKETELNEVYLEERRTYEANLRSIQSTENAYSETINSRKEMLEKLKNDEALIIKRNDKLQAKQQKILESIDKIEIELQQCIDEEVERRVSSRKERIKEKQEALQDYRTEIFKYEDDVNSLALENNSLRAAGGVTESTYSLASRPTSPIGHNSVQGLYNSLSSMNNQTWSYK